MQLFFVPISIGQNLNLQGLHKLDKPEIVDSASVRLLGAWQLGYGTTEQGGIVDHGRDWFALAWRTADGRLGSYGRVRDHWEYLGLEDIKTFYSTREPDERELMRIYDRAAEWLSEEWGVELRKVVGIDGSGLLNWLESLGDVSLSFLSHG